MGNKREGVETKVSLSLRGEGNSSGAESGQCDWLSPTKLDAHGVEFWTTTLRSRCLSPEGGDCGGWGEGCGV